MRRREFIAGLGGAAAWPVVAAAQQTALPVIGILSESTAESVATTRLPAFVKGLKETGFVEGQNATEPVYAATSSSRGPDPRRIPGAATDVQRLGLCCVNTLSARLWRRSGFRRLERLPQ
jgi:hypothetical protein